MPPASPALLQVSRWPAVLAALVDLHRDMPGYRDPTERGASAQLVPVFDGPPVNTGDHATALVVYGFAGEPESPDDAGGLEWDVATSGNAERDEAGEVEGYLIAQSGETDPTPFRALDEIAFGLLGDAFAMVRANPTLGLTGKRMFVRWRSAKGPRRYIAAGPVVRINFTIRYEARITLPPYP